jgi:beta-glucosidase
MKKNFGFVFVFFGFTSLALSQGSAVDQKIDSLLSIMTVEEKLGQLNQMGGTWNENRTERIDSEETQLLRQGKIGSFLGIIGAAETGRIQHIAVQESRLHIPVLFGLDVIHGFRTVFPIPLAEASTWNPDLVEREARVSAIEASAAGVHWTFAPMVDVARDPRWGRIAEGAGEDPFLGSAMAAARVKGFQGKDVRAPQSILACAKHFAGYGAAEAGRDYNTAEVSERTMREIYLPPFKAAVGAGAWTLMSAFNDIAGVPSSCNRWLLTDVLRGEWGFAGFVVSDWDAIAELQNHRVAASRTDVGIRALKAGVDMDMVSRIYEKELVVACNEKKISEAVVDQSVRRVLRTKYAYGLFDNPYRNCDSLREKRDILTPEHRAFARNVAQQSIVLLKNEHRTLPLRKSAGTIALIGPLVDEKRNLLGPWDGVGRAEDVVTVLAGVKEKISAGTKLLIAKGCEISSDSGGKIDEAVKIARQADIVVVVLGEPARMSGEAASRSNLDLPGLQMQLLEALHNTGKPIVLVIMNGRPLLLSWEAENIDAIVEGWFLGIETGNAIADILFGDVNPSGKLPVSFPRNMGQIPIYYNHRSTGRPFQEAEHFTSRYLDVPNTPLYPFGYGLSYTNFKYTNLRVLSPSIAKESDVHVSVDVENAGERTGDEIVQLYIEDEVADVALPVKELKGFKRITLRPGEKKRVDFTLTAQDLSYYNAAMQRVEDPGGFRIFVGGNSVDVLEAGFVVQ